MVSGENRSVLRNQIIQKLELTGKIQEGVQRKQMYMQQVQTVIKKAVFYMSSREVYITRVLVIIPAHGCKIAIAPHSMFRDSSASPNTQLAPG